MKQKVLLLFALLVSSTMAWAANNRGYTWDEDTKTLTITTATDDVWTLASLYRSNCVNLVIEDGVAISIGVEFKGKSPLPPSPSVIV